MVTEAVSREYSNQGLVLTTHSQFGTKVKHG